MSIASESAEQMTKMMLDGTEVVLKITGEASKELIVLLYTVMKDNKQTNGKVKITNMLKSGKELKVFSIKQEDLKKFMSEAKRYGILYTALVSKKGDKDGMVDIIVKTEDAARINRIISRFNLITVDKCEIENVSKQELDEKSPLVEETQLEKKSKESKKEEKEEWKTKKSVREDLKIAKEEAKKINKNKIVPTKNKDLNR